MSETPNIAEPSEAPASEDQHHFVAAGMAAVNEATADRANTHAVSFADLERAVAAVFSHVATALHLAAPVVAEAPPPDAAGQGQSG